MVLRYSSTSLVKAVLERDVDSLHVNVMFFTRFAAGAMGDVGVGVTEKVSQQHLKVE